MSQRQVRRLITWVSAALGLVGIIVGVYDRYIGVPLPLWGVLFLAYGGVYLLILPFDWIGRQASKFRSDKDALQRPKRPPVRPSSGEQRLAVEAPYVRLDEVRLERASVETAAAFQWLLDEAVTELSALQNRLPDRDEAGHVKSHRIDAWLTDADEYPFFIRYHDDPVGICVARARNGYLQLVLIYVISSWRQRRIASAALSRMKEFARMLGLPEGMDAWVPMGNARARRFLQTVGFRVEPDTGVQAYDDDGMHDPGATRYVLDFRTAAPGNTRA